MKVAAKVILLLNGGDGLASAISGGLITSPNSNFQTLKESFELPLDSYGINDHKASGQMIHFVSSNGDYEVSILLLQVYEAPILACALHEVLLKLAGDDSSNVLTLVVPSIVPESMLRQENKYSVKSDNVSVYGIKLGPTTDVTEALSSQLQKPPQFLQIFREDLATLIHLVNVMKLPTVVLIGQSVQVISQLGEHLASVSSLSFSKDNTVQNPTKTSKDDKEAWRALYG